MSQANWIKHPAVQREWCVECYQQKPLWSVTLGNYGSDTYRVCRGCLDNFCRDNSLKAVNV